MYVDDIGSRDQKRCRVETPKHQFVVSYKGKQMLCLPSTSSGSGTAKDGYFINSCLGKTGVTRTEKAYFAVTSKESENLGNGNELLSKRIKSSPDVYPQNILKLKKCRVWRISGGKHLPTDKVALVSRFYPGKVEAMSHSLETQHKIKIITDTARGLASLHALNLIHKDIAARNVLFKDDHAVLIDLDEVEDAMTPKPMTKHRPVFEMPPEFFMNNTPSKQSDVFMFGLFILEAFIGNDFKQKLNYERLEKALEWLKSPEGQMYLKTEEGKQKFDTMKNFIADRVGMDEELSVLFESNAFLDEELDELYDQLVDYEVACTFTSTCISLHMLGTRNKSGVNENISLALGKKLQEIPIEHRSLVLSCLDNDPKKRPSAANILHILTK